VKYRQGQAKPISLDKVRCPICNGKINKFYPVQHYSWNHDLVLLAECWTDSKDFKEHPSHLFLIEIEDILPKVSIYKTTKVQKLKESVGDKKCVM
jgi:hypothetical protein